MTALHQVYRLADDWKLIDGRANRVKRLQRAVLTAANLFQREQGGRLYTCWMVTLTYRPDAEWSAKQISSCRDALRKWCDRLGVVPRTIWVLELTKAGVPHYHLCIWLPRHLTLPKFDNRGWWTHGLTRTERAKFAPGYLAKYVSKGATCTVDADGNEVAHTFPKGARLYGVGGLKDIARVEWRWWMMPRWMREAIGWLGQAKRMKGGYVCKQTGEIFATPYEVILRGGRCWFRLKPHESLSANQTCYSLAA